MARGLDRGLPGRTSRQLIGSAAEDQALTLLEARGLQLIARNWSCRGGELDLTMRDARTLVFVEVRRRSSGRHGGAAASIDSRKQARLIRAANNFLATHREYAAFPARFDVVVFDGQREPQWLRAAFSAPAS